MRLRRQILRHMEMALIQTLWRRSWPWGSSTSGSSHLDAVWVPRSPRRSCPSSWATCDCWPSGSRSCPFQSPARLGDPGKNGNDDKTSIFMEKKSCKRDCFCYFYPTWISAFRRVPKRYICHDNQYLNRSLKSDPSCSIPRDFPQKPYSHSPFLFLNGHFCTKAAKVLANFLHLKLQR